MEENTEKPLDQSLRVHIFSVSFITGTVKPKLMCICLFCVRCSEILFLLILLFLIPFFFGPLINQCSEYEVVLPGSTLSMQTEPSIKLPLAPSGGIRLYVSIQYPVSFIPDPL